MFVGEKGVGKSSLIAKYLDESVGDEMPATTALDFKHGLKEREERKVKVNVYELGGGRNQAHMLSACLNEGTIADTSVCVVVDLSNPGNSIDSLLFWINAVREQSQVALQKLEKSNPLAFHSLQRSIQEKWAEHEDGRKIQHSMVPLVILGSKFDAFANKYESVQKKQVCLALRYLAHVNGADLVFGSVREKVPSQLYRALLSFHVFSGGALGKVEKNQNQPINVPAGQDSFSQIGEPDGA